MDNDAQAMLKEILVERKISKYRLAKELLISWNTLHYWMKGFWKPKEENMVKILALYELIKGDSHGR